MALHGLNPSVPPLVPVRRFAHSAPLPPAPPPRRNTHPLPSASAPAVSAPSSSNKVLISPIVLDMGSLIANLADKTHGLYDRVHVSLGTRDPVGIVGLGTASILSAVNSCHTTYTGYYDIQEAKRVGDTQGEVLADIKTIRGGISTFTKCASIPLKMIPYTAVLSTSERVLLVSGILKRVFSSLGSLVGVLFLASLLIRLCEQRRFEAELQAVLDGAIPGEKSQKALEFLQAKLSIQNEEKVKIARSVRADHPTESGDGILAKIAEEEAKLLEKKEKILKRVLDGSCIKMIRASDADPNGVIEKVWEKSFYNKTLNEMRMAVTMIAIGCMIVATISTGGTALLIAEVLGSSAALGAFGIDLYDLIDAFRNGNPAGYDQFFLLGSSVLSCTAVTIASILSEDPMALQAALGFGFFWLLMNLICYYRITQVESGKAQPQAAPVATG